MNEDLNKRPDTAPEESAHTSPLHAALRTVRKPIHGFQLFMEGLLRRRPVLITLSVLAAVLIWFTISVTVYKTTHVTVNHIPVEVELTGTAAEAAGLSVVSCDLDTVNAVITGNRSEVGILTNKDLTAYAELGNISTSGEYTLDIVLRTENGIAFTAESISPAHAVVSLDKIETRPYDVTAAFPYISITAGHAMAEDEITCEPPTINITGPATQLDEIGRVEVYTDKSLSLDSTYSLYASKVNLYTDEGAILDTDTYEIPATSFQINIPILTQMELPLTYTIRNAPTTFDEDWLRERLTLSEDSITLASKTNTALASQKDWNVGFTKLDDIGLDYSNTFTIDTGEELINRSNLQQVTLTLDNEGLASRDLAVTRDNINVINVPSGYDFDVVTKSLTVTVIGPEEELEELNAKDIIVAVDLQNHEITQSMSFTEDASISFYNEEHLWAVGSYKIAIDSIAHDTETTAATESTT
ncbi:MAG: hypothetical protein IJ055_10205 [Oscillospiraceae bacterium]|nr:hypothetical protein [Oscillospiraceae bacterium]